MNKSLILTVFLASATPALAQWTPQSGLPQVQPLLRQEQQAQSFVPPSGGRHTLDPQPAEKKFGIQNDNSPDKFRTPKQGKKFVIQTDPADDD
jgi:hypothetical protein